MPPWSGWREDSSRTASAKGTKKARQAMPQTASAPGPVAAAVAIQRRLKLVAT
jgi:hypothetical protein